MKKEFGKHLCFWGGGVDTQNVLPFGTEREVRDHVRKNIDIFSNHGGYIFNPVHNIQAATPTENILTAFDQAKTYRM